MDGSREMSPVLFVDFYPGSWSVMFVGHGQLKLLGLFAFYSLGPCRECDYIACSLPPRSVVIVGHGRLHVGC